ncbi:MAG: DUF1622 domain-containing protein [Chloroflexota bacterium]|nr:DUF1622 domain-containing protein [Chloroflexota bacterium]
MSDENPPDTKQDEHWMSYILPVALIAGLVALLKIISSQPPEETVSIIPQEALLTQVVSYLILASEAAAAFVIGSAMVRAVISYVKHLLDPMSRQINHTEQIRLRLGHMLNLGLEFAIGSDILRLATSPTTADVIILFAIVLLRILLNYFLEREIKSSLVSVVQVTTSPPSNNQMEK